MNIEQITKLLSQGEDQTIEFKLSFNKQAIETIVAFSNKKGGKLLLGISDKGETVGIELNSESIQNWQNEIKTKTEPSIFPEIEEFQFLGVLIDDLFLMINVL